MKSRASKRQSTRRQFKSLPPSDFIHCLLCLHSYKNSQPNDPVEFPLEQKHLYPNNEYLRNWKIKNIYQFDRIELLNAVLYENNKDYQMVLAFRGLHYKHLSQFNSNSEFQTLFCEKMSRIIKNPYKTDIYKECKEIITLSYDKRCFLSFTGYNLGGLMAQLCLAFCFKQASFDTFVSKAVLFDPIGGEESIQDFTRRKENKENDFNEIVGSTVTYLSIPTTLNCCIKHVAGSIYHIYPPLPTLDSLNHWFPLGKHLSDWIKYDLFSISEINLQNILKTFNMSTNKPKRYSVVEEWPYMKKESWDDNDDEIIFRIVKVLSKYEITSSEDVDSLKYRLIDHDTLHEMIPDMNGRKIDYEDDDGTAHDIQFLGKCVAKTEDPFKSHIKKAADRYLIQLQSIILPGHDEISQMLQQLKEEFEIQEEKLVKYIVCKKSTTASTTTIATADNLRDQMRSLLVFPGVKETIRLAETQNKYVLKNCLPLRSSDINYIPTKNAQGIDLMELVEKELKENKILVLNSFAGCGKTTLASQFAQCKKDYLGVTVRWINATSTKSILNDYLTAFCEIDIIEKYNKNLISLRKNSKKMDKNVIDAEAELGHKVSVACKIMRTVMTNTISDILLVFDDVANYEDVAPFVSNLPAHVRVLITSRLDCVFDKWKHIKIHPFNQKEASQYLIETLTSKDEIIIENLMNVFKTEGGWLPLKLRLAVGALNNDVLLTVEAYMKLINEYGDQTNALINQLDKYPLAWKLMQYVAFFDIQDVEMNLIKLFIKDKDIQEAINQLVRICLIDIVTKNNNKDDSTCIRMHMLVKETIQNYMKNGGENALKPADIVSHVILVFHDKFPRVMQNPDDLWSLSRRLYRFICKLKHLFPTENHEITNATREQLAGLYENIFWYLWHVESDWSDALTIAMERLKLLQVYFPENTNEIAWTMMEMIGRIYLNTGQKIKALDMLASAREIYQCKKAKANRKNMARVYEYLAHCHRDLGNYKEAMKYLDESMQMNQILFGDRHQRTVQCLDCKSMILHHQGNYEAAIKCFQDLLELKEEFCKEGDVSTTLYLHRIAKCYGDFGDLDKSMEYHKKCLVLIQKLYGEKHTDIANSLNDVGVCHYDKGHFKEALRYFNESLTMLQKLFGEKHYLIARALSNLGFCYRGLGELQSALKYHEDAFQMRKDLDAVLQWDIVHSLNNIAFCCRLLNDNKKAFDYYKKSYQVRQQIYEQPHQHLQMCLRCNGECSYNKEDLDFILTFYLELYEKTKVKYGESHKKVADCLDQMGFSSTDGGDFASALYSHDDALKMRMEIYENKCVVEIGNSFYNCGNACLRMKDKNESLQYFEKALDLFSELFPDGHHAIKATQGNIQVVKYELE